MSGFYSRARWERRRRHQLQTQPLCRLCLQHGIVEPATVADHVEPHGGDANKFWLGTLQSLCKRHHDSDKKFLENRGYARDIGPDGWPLDPRHPVYKKL